VLFFRLLIVISHRKALLDWVRVSEYLVIMCVLSFQISGPSIRLDGQMLSEVYKPLQALVLRLMRMPLIANVSSKERISASILTGCGCRC